jgi:hypothetical protein
MAPYWGKGGILWLSYLLNEFGDPDFFVWFYFKYIINSMPGKFQHILISGTITAELHIYIYIYIYIQLFCVAYYCRKQVVGLSTRHDSCRRYGVTISNCQFHFAFILCPEGIVSTFMYVGGVKIPCGLLPTRFSSNFVWNSITFKNCEISDTFLTKITYIIWKLAKKQH